MRTKKRYRAVIKHDSQTHQNGNQTTNKTQSNIRGPKIQQNLPMERPIVEKGLRGNEKRVRFAAEGSLNETKNHHLRETGDDTPRGLNAWRLYIWFLFLD